MAASVLHSPDGATWASEPSPTDEELLAITNGTTGFVAVAGTRTILFSADGHSWSTVSAEDGM